VKRCCESSVRTNGKTINNVRLSAQSLNETLCGFEARLRVEAKIEAPPEPEIEEGEFTVETEH